MTKKRVTGETDVRVNQRFVDELIAQNTSAKSRKKTTDVEALISDDRFKVMFEDEEFKRDHRLEASKRTVSADFFTIAKIDLSENIFCSMAMQ